MKNDMENETEMFDFGTENQKALEKALHEYARNNEDAGFTDTHLYCGFTINIHIYDFTDFGEEQVAEIDFLSETKVLLWKRFDEWEFPEAIKKIIEKHGYTIETVFEKLSKEEKALLGYEE